jgi:hypothetical protein
VVNDYIAVIKFSFLYRDSCIDFFTSVDNESMMVVGLGRSQKFI